MVSSTLTDIEEIGRLDQRPSLSSEHSSGAVTIALAAMFLAVAASQWGVIVLSYIYAVFGRVDFAVTPEFLLGGIAMFLMVVLVTRFDIRWPDKPAQVSALIVFVLFALLGATSELLQPQMDFRNVVRLVVLFTYILVGYACGYVIGDAQVDKFLRVLLVIFVLWYGGLIALGVMGHLSVEKILSGATLSRLEGVDGFAATELPIYSGMQLPIVLMILTGPFGTWTKFFAWTVLFSIVALLVLTASVGAIGASLLVGVVTFIFSKPEIKRKVLGFSLVAAAAFLVIGGSYLIEIYLSVVFKINRLSIGGGRAELYDKVLQTALDNPWIGVGLSKFQYMVSFGPTGKNVFPHNNVLGIGAELGIPAALAYLLFVILLFWVFARGIRKLQRSGFESRAALVTAVLGILTYQQVRGVLQDTWLVKELYLWVGLALGVMACKGRLLFMQVIGQRI